MAGLAEAWAEHDRQCLRRGGDKRGRDARLPTVDATEALAAEVDGLAGRLGVSGHELRAWMQALRRAGHDVAACSAVLEQTADSLDASAL